MKKLGLQLALIPVLLGSIFASFTTAESNPFTDISQSYARNEITLLHKQGIVVGDGDGRFHPDQPVTRAEFVTMLGRTLGVKPVYSPIQAFQDVPENAWANGWIQAASQLGIVGGTSPSTFHPSKYISRQEAAAILVRSNRMPGEIVSNQQWIDQQEIATWAVPYVRKAIGSGLMTGYQGLFRPNGQMTRQELAVVLSRIVSIPASGKNERSIELAWQYGGTTSDFIKQVQKSPVNVLSPRWFFLNDAGKVSGSGDPALVKWAHQNGKQVWAMIGNRFKADLTHSVISQAPQRKAVINQIVQYAKQYQLDGINIDFENVKTSDRNNYTLFINELSTALKANNVLLSVDVPPDLGNSWSAAYDYQALGRAVDYLIVMSYDEHWNGSPKAGSVASLPWFEQHLRKITQVVSAKKVIAGIPLYTRDWSHTNGKVVSKDMVIQEQYQLIADRRAQVRWDQRQGQYIASYTKENIVHSIWVEDSRSISEKIRAANQLGISGRAYWHMGGGTPDVWTTVENISKWHSR